MDFGKKLAEDRISKGLTQEELAELCGINIRTIQRIESGEVKPRLHTLKAIARQLQTDYIGLVATENQTKPASDPNSSTWVWHLKDLFNLKTQRMKKLTILSVCLGIIIVSGLMMTAKVQAQINGKPKPQTGLTISYNEDQSVARVDAVFTNELTFDSLVNIAAQLKEVGIYLNYKGLTFDDNGHLYSIDCKVRSDDQVAAGSFGGRMLSQTPTHPIGFSFDFSDNAKSPLCTGNCWN